MVSSLLFRSVYVAIIKPFTYYLYCIFFMTVHVHGEHHFAERTYADVLEELELVYVVKVMF